MTLLILVYKCYIFPGANFPVNCDFRLQRNSFSLISFGPHPQCRKFHSNTLLTAIAMYCFQFSFSFLILKILLYVSFFLIFLSSLNLSLTCNPYLSISGEDLDSTPSKCGVTLALRSEQSPGNLTYGKRWHPKIHIRYAGDIGNHCERLFYGVGCRHSGYKTLLGCFCNFEVCVFDFK